jgi:hypothetical protein
MIINDKMSTKIRNSIIQFVHYKSMSSDLSLIDMNIIIYEIAKFETLNIIIMDCVIAKYENE